MMVLKGNYFHYYFLHYLFSHRKIYIWLTTITHSILFCNEKIFLFILNYCYYSFTCIHTSKTPFQIMSFQGSKAQGAKRSRPPSEKPSNESNIPPLLMMNSQLLAQHQLQQLLQQPSPTQLQQLLQQQQSIFLQQQQVLIPLFPINTS